jgi:hypothetical protein
MLDSFFGVHPHVLRTGLWRKMKPGEKDLYLYLMEESERCCTREIQATDAQISKLVRTASRTLCNARKKLQELGLIRYRSGQGNKYTYVICNPKTGQPYPGDPRSPIIVPKRNRTSTEHPSIPDGGRSFAGDGFSKQQSLEAHGVPGIF